MALRLHIFNPEHDIALAHGSPLFTSPRAGRPGHIVRRLYTEGEGCPSLICVEQDYTGKAKDIALAYASGIGAGRAGILQTTFKVWEDYLPLENPLKLSTM